MIGTISEFLGLDRALLLIVVFCAMIAIFAGRVNQKETSIQISPESKNKS